MKKWLLCALSTLLIFSSCKSHSQTFTISGTLDEKEGIVELRTIESRKSFPVDSCVLKNGEFKFICPLGEPTMAGIKLIGNRSMAQFFLDNHDLTIKGSIKNMTGMFNLKINGDGSALHDKISAFKNNRRELFGSRFRELKSQRNEIVKLIKTSDPKEFKTSLSELNDLENKLNEELDAFVVNKITTSGDQVFSVILISTYLITSENLTTLYKAKELYSGLAEEARNSKFEKGTLDYLEKRIELVKNKKSTKIGDLFVDFTAADVNGKPIDLASVVKNNKYTLLEFWASWCGPCMHEIPHLKEAYKKYHDKGFEVLAFSLDSKKESWLKAIKKKNLPWLHVSELKGWESTVPEKYAVRGIPANVLIDNQGIIVAKNLKGHKLELELERLFSK